MAQQTHASLAAELYQELQTFLSDPANDDGGGGAAAAPKQAGDCADLPASRGFKFNPDASGAGNTSPGAPAGGDAVDERELNNFVEAEDSAMLPDEAGEVRSIDPPSASSPLRCQSVAQAQFLGREGGPGHGLHARKT